MVVDPKEIVNMVNRYKEKIKEIAPKTSGLAHNEIELSKEYLGLVLDRASVEKLLEQDGAGDLIALFAIEKEKIAGAYEDKNRNTIILMALDSKGELLRDASGEFARAEETWPIKLALNDDSEFEKFFGGSLNPPA